MARSRTNIEIDDDHVQVIMARYGVRTKTAAVDLALRHLAGDAPVPAGLDTGGPDVARQNRPHGLGQLIRAGRARPPRRDVGDLPAPEPGPNLSDDLFRTRAAERY